MADLDPTPLDDRPLSRPARQRLAHDHPDRERILTAHARALAAGERAYADPATGLLVLTGAFLAARGSCCGSGCRHCPYVRDQGLRDQGVRDQGVRDQGEQGVEEPPSA